jgi:glyoxylase-like metal-dependent hydrolase (beta-lactamase superfamily II)
VNRVVERVVTTGVFTLDGQSFDVENNVWIVGVESVVVIDPAHDADRILAAVAGRPVDAVVCTHGHNDHINAAVQVAGGTDAPVYLHPADRMLWDDVHPERPPDRDLAEGDRIGPLSVLHTPGHSPGGVCLYAADLGLVFSGDTLFAGGPGATGRSYSDFPTILRSIEERLLTLPTATRVLTGHGEQTTIRAEAPHLEQWRVRGH